MGHVSNFWRGIPEMKSFLQGRLPVATPCHSFPPFKPTMFFGGAEHPALKIRVCAPLIQLGSVDGWNQVFTSGFTRVFAHCDLTWFQPGLQLHAMVISQESSTSNFAIDSGRFLDEKTRATKKNRWENRGCCKEFWCVAKNLFSKKLNDCWCMLFG